MVARYIISAARPEQFPEGERPEFAFLGRSNVGKSSLLNHLVDQTGLAFTSQRPGCTQTINFYQVGVKYQFADLPGYGYARGPKGHLDEWKKLIEAYLLTRKQLQLCFLLVDARRGWMDKDLELREWLEFQGRPYQVVATKVDKLKSQSERHHALTALKKGLPNQEPVLFSAITGQGVREIWQTITNLKLNSPS